MRGRELLSGARVVVLVATLAVSGCGDSPGDSPEGVVQAVLDARANGECDGYDDLFVGDPLPRCGEAEDVVGDGPKVGEPEVDGDRATVEVVDLFGCGWGEPAHEYTDVYHLVLDDGGWKVDDWVSAEPTSDDCFS